jgi:hypothetical protein
MLTLHQAEWCPFSAAVRERLTELGLDVVIRQVAPYQEQRPGKLSIPVLETDDGTRFAGTQEIFGFLAGIEENEFTVQHRERYHEHRPARASEATGVILEHATPGGHAADGPVADGLIPDGPAT